MSTSTRLTAKDMLAQERLVQSALPSVDDVAVRLSRKKPVKLVYGETYDAFGLTLDSLKYYFSLALLQEQIRKQGVKVTAAVIVGDLHSVKNKIVQDKNSLLASAGSRYETAQKIATVYGLDIEPVLMSKLFKDSSFQKRLDAIAPIFQQSDELQAIARQTVLTNRLSQEEKAGFQYALEEVALITAFDVKIGPPREVHYDKLAHLLSPTVDKADFSAIYLTPTYPLGLGFDYFVTHPEIEEYGLTPYKAGSNKLQEHRIILGFTTPEQCRRLIDSSFTPKNPALPNPVFDVYLIAQLAGHFLRGEDFVVNENLAADPLALKAVAYEQLIKNIYEPLGLTL